MARRGARRPIKEGPPDPLNCASTDQLLERLVDLRRWAGQPSLHRLRKLGGTYTTADGSTTDALPETTVSGILRGRRIYKVPRLLIVERFVEACLRAGGYPSDALAGEVDRWRTAWRPLSKGIPVQRAPSDLPLTPVSHSTIVPRQLPTADLGFAGRHAELEQLDLWLQAAAEQRVAPLLMLIAGPTGIGKTALASQWAHRVVDQFPDGQLYANLDEGTSSRRPKAPDGVLAAFLRGYGITNVPSDREERAATFRSISVGQRILVFLDAVSSVEQVLPLLPGTSGCAVIITACAQMGDLVVHLGARRLLLSPLSFSESCQVITHSINQAGVQISQKQIEVVATECEGHPLRLRAAAERLMRARLTEGVGQQSRRRV